MTEYRDIKIDFDVNRAIELARRSFSEQPNDVLRRLLNVDEVVDLSAGSGRAWSSGGVTLPHGTQLRMEYNGRVHVGEINDGVWHVEGGNYKSPSGAASGVARTKAGKRTSLDGWLYWSARKPGESEWVNMNVLHRAANA